MHGSSDVASDVTSDAAGTQQNAFSEPLHVAISGHDIPDYDMIELLIDAGLNLECTVNLY